MVIYVKDLKNNKSWILDHDCKKPVYLDSSNNTIFDLKDISNFKFYPCDPDNIVNSFYQYHLFDFM